MEGETLHEVGNHAVDAIAIGALAYLGHATPGDGVTQILAAGVVSVALGKRYITGARAG
jgi:hypothetical protein